MSEKPPGSCAFQSVAGLILAAGKGTRMKSDLPKVLHPLAGRPMVEWVIQSLASIGAGGVHLMVGDDLGCFDALLQRYPDIKVARQVNRQGTGDAVAAAHGLFFGVDKPPFAKGEVLRGAAKEFEHILILAGDVPGISPDLLKDFLKQALAKDASLAVLGMEVPDPKGYGRLILDAKGDLVKIVEERDANSDQKKIQLVNSGIVFGKAKHLFNMLAKLTPQNSQNEYYLTDCFEFSRAAGAAAMVYRTKDWAQFSGINDRMQLAAVEEWLMEQKKQQLMKEGVTFELPATSYIGSEVEVGGESNIGIGVNLRGKTVIGRGCRIQSHATIVDSVIEDGVTIGEGSVVKGATVSKNDEVMPLSARILKK